MFQSGLDADRAPQLKRSVRRLLYSIFALELEEKYELTKFLIFANRNFPLSPM